MSESNLKTHYSAKELLAFSLSALPNSVQGIIYQAKKQKWATQKRVGQGGGFEYALASLPKEIQQQIKLAYLRRLSKPEKDTAPKPSLALALNNATDKARAEAAKKAKAVRLVHDHLSLGIGLMQALEAVSNERGLKVGSLKNWFYKVQGYNIHEWTSVLIKQTGKQEKTKQKATVEEEVWKFFISDYLRPEQPSLKACYRRAVEFASDIGCDIPSRQTFQRKLLAEIPYEVIVYKREGENATAKLAPALQDFTQEEATAKSLITITGVKMGWHGKPF